MLIEVFEGYPEVIIFRENGYWNTIKASVKNIEIFINKFCKEYGDENTVYAITISYENKKYDFLGNREFLIENLNKTLTI